MKIGVAIGTDQFACIPAEVAQRYHIHILPHLLIFGDQVFRNGGDMTPTSFYARLRQGNELTTTTSPSLGRR